MHRSLNITHHNSSQGNLAKQRGRAHRVAKSQGFSLNTFRKRILASLRKKKDQSENVSEKKAPIPSESGLGCAERLKKLTEVERSDAIEIPKIDRSGRHPLWRAHLILA